MNYLAIMIHCVNHRYETLSDPKINFKVVGIRAMKVCTNYIAA